MKFEALTHSTRSSTRFLLLQQPALTFWHCLLVLPNACPVPAPTAPLSPSLPFPLLHFRLPTSTYAHL